MLSRVRNLSRWLFWPGLVLFLVASFVLAKDITWYKTRTWYAVDMPVDLRTGSIATQQFTVNLSERFTILLQVDRNTPENVSRTVLGVSEPGSPTVAESGGFKLRWRVSSKGAIVKEGLSNGRGEEFWSVKKGRVLGYFQAREGETYRLDLNALEDGSALQPYDPRIEVKVDLFTLDGYAMEQGFSQLVAFGFVVVGLLLMTPSVADRVSFLIRSRRGDAGTHE
jgi:hypothetical protein